MNERKKKHLELARSNQNMLATKEVGRKFEKQKIDIEKEEITHSVNQYRLERQLKDNKEK